MLKIHPRTLNGRDLLREVVTIGLRELDPHGTKDIKRRIEQTLKDLVCSGIKSNEEDCLRDMSRYAIEQIVTGEAWQATEYFVIPHWAQSYIAGDFKFNYKVDDTRKINNCGMRVMQLQVDGSPMAVLTFASQIPGEKIWGLYNLRYHYDDGGIEQVLETELGAGGGQGTKLIGALNIYRMRQSLER